MASITITRRADDYGGYGFGMGLISAFLPTSIEFDFDRGAEVGTYAKLTIGTSSFFCTKLSTVGNVDKYIVSLTGILPYYLGFPPTSITTTGLVKTIDMTIDGYKANGDALATLDHPQIKLNFSISDISTAAPSLATGSSRPIYHNGTIYYYQPSINGYKSASFPTTGTYTEGDVEIQSIYKSLPTNSTVLIHWINCDGAWSSWRFRYISDEKQISKTNEIPLFAKTSIYEVAKSLTISTEKKVVYNLDTIAVDETHYRYLTEIEESPRVIFYDKVCRATCSKVVAQCRQNLKFTLTLEIDDNAVTY